MTQGCKRRIKSRSIRTKHRPKPKTKNFSPTQCQGSKERFSLRVLQWKSANNSKSEKCSLVRSSEETSTCLRTCNLVCRSTHGHVRRYSQLSRSFPRLLSKATQSTMLASPSRELTLRWMMLNRKRFLPTSNARHTSMGSS